jgi:hypothetical protein
MDQAEHDALAAYCRCEMSALELRRRPGGATYGEVLERLFEAGLPRPRAPVAGREGQIAQARRWLFPPETGLPK